MNAEAPSDDKPQLQTIENQSLVVSKWANLFMGVCGIAAAWLSNSEAILLDGLFSGIGFFSAVIAARVGKVVTKPPDRHRPYGYEADEALYTTFRSLSLLGLILFAAVSALMRILTYLNGGDVPDLKFGPMVIYFVVICVTCAGLAILHRANWRRTGRKSEILKLESSAAIVDGAITAGAGIGLMAIPFLEGTPLEGIIPIGDSLVLLILCACIVVHPIYSFRQGLAELAGVSANPAIIKSVRRIVREATADRDLRIVDVSASKIGRVYTIAAYLDPVHPVTAEAVDALTRDLEARAQDALGTVRVYVIISKYGRAWTINTS